MSGQQFGGRVRVTVRNADGTVRCSLGTVTVPPTAGRVTRPLWQAWIAAKFSYHRARRRI